MHLPKRYKYLIGIDPGVETGIAFWCTDPKGLHSVESMPIHQAMAKIRSWADHFGTLFLVRVEDARKRRWFAKTGPEVWKGAGSISRDCKIWEDFLIDIDVPFELVAPKDNRTKLRAPSFKAMTGWLKPTNEHARDAAMLVYGY